MYICMYVLLLLITIKFATGFKHSSTFLVADRRVVMVEVVVVMVMVVMVVVVVVVVMTKITMTDNDVPDTCNPYTQGPYSFDSLPFRDIIILTAVTWRKPERQHTLSIASNSCCTRLD